MNWLKNTARRLFKLFVDDGRLAAASLLWLVLVWLLGQLPAIATWRGPILFAGLAAILLASVALRSRPH